MKNSILIALEIIGIIIILGLFAFLLSQKSLIISYCENETTISQKDICYSIYTIKNQDIRLSENIENKTLRDYVYIVLADDNQDVSICTNKIKDKNNEVRCFKNIAREMDDQKICDKYVKDIDEKYDCYRIVSLTGKDKEICKSFDDPDLKSVCLGNLLSSIKPEGPISVSFFQKLF